MILFSESDINIDGMFALSQLLFEDKMTLTLFGELHGKFWTCNGNKISPWEYCAKRISENDKCKVLLEYSKEVSEKSLSLVNSKHLKETFKTLQQNNMNDKIIPFDIRQQYLGFDNYQTLYHSKYVYNKIKSKKYNLIYEKFILPFFQKNINIPNNIIKELKPLLSNTLEEINKDFKSIVQKLKQEKPSNTVLRLKKVWQKVSDFFVLCMISKNTQDNEYIIISGMHHFDYLQDKLKNICLQVNLQDYDENRNSNNCVKCYEPIIV